MWIRLEVKMLGNSRREDPGYQQEKSRRGEQQEKVSKAK
jgi:hypothetical protein